MKRAKKRSVTKAFRASGRAASKRFLSIVVGIVSLATILFLVLSLQKSGTISQERLQFVVYGKDTKVYSLGLTDGIHYVISYPAQYKIETPGGYGEYRVGALGHLVGQEHEARILTRAMSLAAHTMVPYYFYHPSKTIWYDSSTEESEAMPSWYDIATMDSNATLYERFMIWQAVARASRADVIAISAADAHVTNPGGDKALSNYKLQKQLEAYLFQETYRQEEMNIQIIYNTSYKTADRIASILEGAGINVVDISEALDDRQGEQPCVVAASTEQVRASKTAHDVASFYGCRLQVGDVDHSDIQLRLGTAEKTWLIK